MNIQKNRNSETMSLMKQWKPKIALLVGLLSIAVFGVTGCKTFKVKTPSGYVTFKRKSNYYRAVSPDNAVIVVQSWKNKPKGSLSFWVETVKRDFVKVRGYKFVKIAAVEAKKGSKGKRLWFESSYRGQMFSYQVSLFVTKKRIYAVESMVEKKSIKRHRKAFQKVIGSLELL